MKTKKTYLAPDTDIIRVALPQPLLGLSTGDDDERGPQGAPGDHFNEDEELEGGGLLWVDDKEDSTRLDVSLDHYPYTL